MQVTKMVPQRPTDASGRQVLYRSLHRSTLPLEKACAQKMANPSNQRALRRDQEED